MEWSKLLLASILMCTPLWAAAPRVCVRSYPVDEQSSPCFKFPIAYAFVQPWTAGKEAAEAEDASGSVCTRIYVDSYCDVAPNEYRHVMTVDGKNICTVHYDQKTIANFCEKLPQFYQYATGRE